MRELKFRVWCANEGMSHSDSKEDDFIPEDEILWNVGFNKITVSTLDLLDLLEDGEHVQKEEYIEHQEYPIMQYTGLKDINGKDIYEGDIIKWGMHKGSEECWHRYAKVELFPSLQFKIIYYVEAETNQKKPTDNYIFEFGRFAYKDTHKHLEVTGNIYENLKLLDETQQN